MKLCRLSRLCTCLMGLFLLSFLLVACTSYEQKSLNCLRSLVQSVERNGSRFSANDWESSVEKFHDLCEQICINSSKYTIDEQREIGSLKARYHKAIVAYIVDNASGMVDDYALQLGGYLEEIDDVDDVFSKLFDVF